MPGHAIAGAKADPSRVRIADISDCAVDPLARTVRRGLRKRHGIAEGIPMVLSTERPRCQLVDVDGLDGNPLDYQVRWRLQLCNRLVMVVFVSLAERAMGARSVCGQW